MAAILMDAHAPSCCPKLFILRGARYFGEAQPSDVMPENGPQREPSRSLRKAHPQQPG
jgi:hypothetical protein